MNCIINSQTRSPVSSSLKEPQAGFGKLKTWVQICKTPDRRACGGVSQGEDVWEKNILSLHLQTWFNMITLLVGEASVESLPLKVSLPWKVS